MLARKVQFARCRVGLGRWWSPLNQSFALFYWLAGSQYFSVEWESE